MSIAYRVVVPMVVALLGLQADAVHAAPGTADWAVAGQNVQNTRDAAHEHVVGPGSVSRLATTWSVTTAGDVRGTPTEDGGTVYFPDSGGKLWALDAGSGQVRWSHSISDYTGIARDTSRTSPAVYGDEIVLGVDSAAGMGASIMAVDRGTGQKLWLTRVDTHRAAIVTSSAVVFRGTVYVGVSSVEEGLAAAPGYVCCTFRGSVVALDAATGRLLWKTNTVPAGYSGGSVWGSTPAINPEAGLLYVGTGNNYSAPPGVCTSPGQTGCTPPAADDHADSVLALDRATGAVRWSTSTLSSDVNNDLCGANLSGSCGPDFDFGSGPNLFRLASGRQLLGIGQKSGVYRALDPDTGAVVWQTLAGPGGAWGGILWGSATDGRRVYVAIANFSGVAYIITSAGGARSTTTGGSWAALDAATGRIVWQVADPQGAMDLGYVSTANGVVYAGSTAATGNDMYALDAATGGILWAFASGGPVVSGAAIVGRALYWGSGYYFATACPGGRRPAEPCRSANDRLYAFDLQDDGRAQSQ
jgi:polyvinyl alcohol dehydrogenase (cytochrome)